MGAWGRVCGPREALWLTILRRGTFLDSRALGKVLGPWAKPLGLGQKSRLGPRCSWCRFVNTTAIFFDCGSRITISFAADALKLLSKQASSP